MDTSAPQLAYAGLAFVEQIGRDNIRALSLAEKRDLVEHAHRVTARTAAEAGQPFSCRGSGCFGCCRGEIVVLDEEAADLLPRLGLEVFERARRNRSALEGETREAICPVLDPRTGRCSAYEHRPMICRAYNVVTPAEWCYPERAGVREVGSVVGPMAVVAGMVIASLPEPDRWSEVEIRGLGLLVLDEADRRAEREVA